MIRRFVAPLTIMLVLVLAACGGSSTTATTEDTSAEGTAENTTVTTQESTSGGTLRVGSTAGFDSVNPFAAFGLTPYRVFPAIYPHLVKYSDSLEFVPEFAETWSVSDDGTQWTFNTVPDATWSDGEPLTAHDVKYTFDTILKYADEGLTANFTSFLSGVTNVDAPDDNTVVVTYDRPRAESYVLDSLSWVPIVPEHIFQPAEGSDGEGILEITNVNPTVSGGPFMVEDFQKDALGTFIKNSAYYGDAPKIDEFAIKVFSNPDAMVAALDAGEIDMIDQLPSTALPAVEGRDDISLLRGPSLTGDVINLNLDPEKDFHRSLLDPKVREAISLAIDRDQIVEIVHEGAAVPSVTQVPPAAGDWSNPNLTPTFDIARANQLLDEAGYAKGSDGIRRDGDEPLSFEVVTTTDNIGVDRTFQIMRDGLAEVGVELTQRHLDPSAATDYRNNNPWDMVLWTSTWSIDPDSVLYWHTCEALGGLNYTGYCNEAYDELYRSQQAELDPAARQALVWDAQELFAQDRPMIVIDHRDLLSPHSSNWQNILSFPDGPLSLLSNQTLLNVSQAG